MSAGVQMISVWSGAWPEAGGEHVERSSAATGPPPVEAQCRPVGPERPQLGPEVHVRRGMERGPPRVGAHHRFEELQALAREIVAFGRGLVLLGVCRAPQAGDAHLGCVERLLQLAQSPRRRSRPRRRTGRPSRWPRAGTGRSSLPVPRPTRPQARPPAPGARARCRRRGRSSGPCRARTCAAPPRCGNSGSAVPSRRAPGRRVPRLRPFWPRAWASQASVSRVAPRSGAGPRRVKVSNAMASSAAASSSAPDATRASPARCRSRAAPTSQPVSSSAVATDRSERGRSAPVGAAKRDVGVDLVRDPRHPLVRSQLGGDPGGGSEGLGIDDPVGAEQIQPVEQQLRANVQEQPGASLAAGSPSSRGPSARPRPRPPGRRPIDWHSGEPWPGRSGPG